MNNCDLPSADDSATHHPFAALEPCPTSGDPAYDAAMLLVWPEVSAIRQRLSGIEHEAEESDTEPTPVLLAERESLLDRRDTLLATVAAAEEAVWPPERRVAVAEHRAAKRAENIRRGDRVTYGDLVQADIDSSREVQADLGAGILAAEARRRGFTGVQPLDVDALPADADDGAAMMLLTLDAPPDLQAVGLLLQERLRGGHSPYDAELAAGLALQSGLDLNSLRSEAQALATILEQLDRQGRKAPLGVLDLVFYLDRWQSAVAAGGLAVKAATVAATEAVAEARPVGRLRFQGEEEWDTKLEWHIDGLLPTHGLGLIFAEPGCGKSLMAAMLAEATAIGALFAGRTVRTGRVVYACPDSPSSTKRRLAALAAEARKRIMALPELELPADAEELATWLEAQQTLGDPVRLLLVDTWDTVRVMSGGGWAQEDANVIECAKILREIAERLKVAIVLIHHSTKNLEAPTARGSAVLRGKLDWEGYLRRVEDGVLELITKKTRDGEMGTVGSFRIVAAPHPADGKPTPRLEYLVGGLAVANAKMQERAAAKAKLDEDRRKVLLGLAAAPDTCRTKAGLAAAVGMSPTSWYRLAKQLREDGLITSRNFFLSAAGQVAAAAADTGLEASP